MGAVVGNTFYFEFEVRFMEWLQQTLGEQGAAFLGHLSFFGEEVCLILVMAFIYWCYDKKLGAYCGTIIAVGCVATAMIKNIFWRRRPYFDHEKIKCLRPVEPGADIYDIAAQGFSFPSGHSVNSVATFTSVGTRVKNKAVKVIGFVIPLLVGLSRNIVGVHYPTDVLCGWLLGLITILFIGHLYDRFGIEKRWILHLIIFIISCLGLFYCRTADYFSSLGFMGGMFLSMEFDRRVVNFENTRQPLECVIRLLGGLVIYTTLNMVLKMPFSPEFLASGTFAANMVRAIRYVIVTFIALGVYPICFKYINFRRK